MALVELLRKVSSIEASFNNVCCEFLRRCRRTERKIMLLAMGEQWQQVGRMNGKVKVLALREEEGCDPDDFAFCVDCGPATVSRRNWGGCLISELFPVVAAGN
jgi:hypothetical protein